jgi:hypothetical protein
MSSDFEHLALRQIRGLSKRNQNVLGAAGIGHEVFGERGNTTLLRTNSNDGPRDTLKRLSFSSKVWNEETRFPGLLIRLVGGDPKQGEA